MTSVIQMSSQIKAAPVASSLWDDCSIGPRVLAPPADTSISTVLTSVSAGEAALLNDKCKMLNMSRRLVAPELCSVGGSLTRTDFQYSTKARPAVYILPTQLIAITNSHLSIGYWCIPWTLVISHWSFASALFSTILVEIGVPPKRRKPLTRFSHVIHTLIHTIIFRGNLSEVTDHEQQPAKSNKFSPSKFFPNSHINVTTTVLSYTGPGLLRR
jgi:hypothetical protein